MSRRSTRQRRAARRRADWCRCYAHLFAQWARGGWRIADGMLVTEALTWAYSGQHWRVAVVFEQLDAPRSRLNETRRAMRAGAHATQIRFDRACRKPSWFPFERG